MSTPEAAQIPDFNVLIVAAGRGARFGNDTPKQYLEIVGKPMVCHSIEAFKSFPQCQSIHIVIHPDDADTAHKALSTYNLPPFIYGDKERNLSIYNGLQALSNLKSEDIILIHDAARPCVRPEDIAALLFSLKDHQAASLAAPVNATLRRNNNGVAAEYIDRNHAYAFQTPQAFRYGDILRAHENADIENATDDSTLATSIGIDVKIVHGSPENIKITRPEDLNMAEKLLSKRTETRSGIGFDVHAFDKNSKGPVRLGGVNIDHDHALKGHSDADVALHAITDALLGAIGEGDIGRHFPPSDDAFKNMDSAIFLEKACEMLKSKNGSITNLDLTIICETPKIGPHAAPITKRIAEICQINDNQINVKATTTEQLGFTGRKEGIAAQALVTVSVQKP